MLERHGDRFLARVFTEQERSCVMRHEKRRVERLAARFAAKEAIAKALGTGISDGISWTDIEVVSEPSGRPAVALHGRAAEVAASLGIASWSLSLTHTGGFSAASAIACAAR